MVGAWVHLVVLYLNGHNVSKPGLRMLEYGIKQNNKLLMIEFGVA